MRLDIQCATIFKMWASLGRFGGMRTARHIKREMKRVSVTWEQVCLLVILRTALICSIPDREGSTRNAATYSWKRRLHRFHPPHHELAVKFPANSRATVSLIAKKAQIRVEKNGERQTCSSPGHNMLTVILTNPWTPSYSPFGSIRPTLPKRKFSVHFASRQIHSKRDIR
jgi:hypothetical protein